MPKTKESITVKPEPVPDIDLSSSSNVDGLKADVENQGKEIKTETIRQDGYNAPAAYSGGHEWEKDRRELARVKHDGLNSFLKSSVYERVSLLRDTLAVSITVLIGAFTLYFTIGTAPQSIKTPSLFLASIPILIIGVVTNLLARSEIVKHLQDVSFRIEKNYIDLYNASREVMKNYSQYNMDTAYRLENESPPFPSLNKLGNNGHIISLWSIVISIVLFAASFIVDISF